MKLILREYIASLRERDELDAILPDLLSQMGFVVLSRPRRGTRQDGVDVAAVGALEDGVERLFLFTLKPGDLTRSDWSARGANQDLYPSLDQIRDVYLRNKIPKKYRDLSVSIRIVIGGDLREDVQSDVVGYFDRNTRDDLDYDVWNGDLLAKFILAYFLREELLPKELQSRLRKALAMLEEPAVASREFDALLSELLRPQPGPQKNTIRAMRQAYLALWILYAWAREADNVRAAQDAADNAILLSWRVAKDYLGKRTKNANAIFGLVNAIITLSLRINSAFFAEKIFPYTGVHYGVSASVRSAEALDVKLQMFDLLGRLAAHGLWLVHIHTVAGDSVDEAAAFRSEIQQCRKAIADLINNNPVLASPVSDDQNVDIRLAVLFLAGDRAFHQFICQWAEEILNRSEFAFHTHAAYPCIYSSYRDLISHPREASEDYRRNATLGSELYPSLALYAALFGDADLFDRIAAIRKEWLSHCNFQFWFPASDSEDLLYTGDDSHGAALDDMDLSQGARAFAEEIFSECDEIDAFEKLSVIKAGVWPILITACRRHRLPAPLHFLRGPRPRTKVDQEQDSAERSRSTSESAAAE